MDGVSFMVETNCAPLALNKHEADIFNFKEDNMLEVTPSAVQQIAEYFKGKEVKPIRIFLNEGG
jgi:hypothetical protein